MASTVAAHHAHYSKPRGKQSALVFEREQLSPMKVLDGLNNQHDMFEDSPSFTALRPRRKFKTVPSNSRFLIDDSASRSELRSSANCNDALLKARQVRNGKPALMLPIASRSSSDPELRSESKDIMLNWRRGSKPGPPAVKHKKKRPPSARGVRHGKGSDTSTSPRGDTDSSGEDSGTNGYPQVPDDLWDRLLDAADEMERSCGSHLLDDSTSHGPRLILNEPRPGRRHDTASKVSSLLWRKMPTAPVFLSSRSSESLEESGGKSSGNAISAFLGRRANRLRSMPAGIFRWGFSS
eukprot:TRINITY_DN11379_c0_g1_i1.p1 TRINITY_DN11379_c0_g1~~TRINITY_DN11379_c0_g1_i1.p1  ORF type:complete len:295 (-),score=27.36 TRINITY_DN11379_c0_g1_i1:381-1265(-)